MVGWPRVYILFLAVHTDQVPCCVSVWHVGTQTTQPPEQARYQDTGNATAHHVSQGWYHDVAHCTMADPQWAPMTSPPIHLSHSTGYLGSHCTTCSVGEVRSQTDWDLVWTGPNPAVLVPVWDFPKNTGSLGLWSGQFHIAWDGPRPSLDRDHLNYLSNVFNIIFLIQLLFYKLLQLFYSCLHNSRHETFHFEKK